MRKKISTIIVCVIFLALIAGVYVLANQGMRKSYTCYEVSADIGGETFRSEVKMYKTWCLRCEGDEPYYWHSAVYVNDQPEAIWGYSFDKCPPNHEMRSMLKNDIEFVKHKGDSKVYVLWPKNRKKRGTSIIYSVEGDKFYEYKEERQIVRTIKRYEAGKIKKKEIDEFQQTMKEYKDIQQRHKRLFEIFSEDEMKALL